MYVILQCRPCFSQYMYVYDLYDISDALNILLRLYIDI